MMGNGCACANRVYRHIECRACEKELCLNDGMTNRCECGVFYNGAGQQLAPPSQWGWETGETFNDDGVQIGFIDGEDW
jgi:hypothetical protein